MSNIRLQHKIKRTYVAKRFLDQSKLYIKLAESRIDKESKPAHQPEKRKGGYNVRDKAAHSCTVILNSFAVKNQDCFYSVFPKSFCLSL